MNHNKLGCLSPLAVVSLFLAIFGLLAAKTLFGNAMFSPGALQAAHADIGNDCSQCHAPFWGPQTMTDLCLACHTETQAELGNSATLHGALVKGRDSACQACHTEHHGADAALTVIDAASFPHESTGYSLAGHQNRSPGVAFACGDCHAESIASFDQAICAECHRSLDAVFTDAHIVDFGEDCLACHDGADRYENFNHDQTSFALTGAHAQAACSACHAGARAVAQLRSTARACDSCHLQDDAHNGEFGAQCGVCHTPEAWKPAKYDHGLSGFPLDGKHVGLKCESCHASGYVGTPSDCYACHQQDDAHQGQYGLTCETCHNARGWQDAAFDHSLSRFPLDGAHANVTCDDCHKNKVFQGTPTECAACHADPAYHLGMFPGQACDQCHTTAAWSPAQYNGPHAFPINHEQEGSRPNTCADCHQPNLTTWTCYPCHDRAKIEEKHVKEGIADFSDCLRCHPTGRKDEGKSDGKDNDDD